MKNRMKNSMLLLALMAGVVELPVQAQTSAKAYDKAIAPAREAYEKAIKPAQETFENPPAYKAYKQAIRPAQEAQMQDQMQAQEDAGYAAQDAQDAAFQGVEWIMTKAKAKMKAEYKPAA